MNVVSGFIMVQFRRSFYASFKQYMTNPQFVSPNVTFLKVMQPPCYCIDIKIWQESTIFLLLTNNKTNKKIVVIDETERDELLLLSYIEDSFGIFFILFCK